MGKHIIITGSLGLIGFETTKFFLKKGYNIIGIDNSIREKLLNIKTNHKNKLNYIKNHFKEKYIHNNIDIRNKEKLEEIFKKYKSKITLVVHTAAQTSHDWSARDPITDFSINALSTLYLLELYRKYSHKAVFIFTSTNKVYGDLVNKFNYIETKTRFDLSKKDPYYCGITEDFPIDQSIHSPFGVSKASADLLVQEYGRYFGLKTGTFRLGVVSGENQDGALHQGFLSYMIKKIKNEREFTIIGYKGKQVRDIIHAKDVVKAFYLFYKNPKKGEVFNLGGGRENSVSVLEILNILKKLSKNDFKTNYYPNPRKGDHKWWISNTSKFKNFYPEWSLEYTVEDIVLKIYKQV